jgi:DNA polymerase I-like protein with 3'-5' exonuclease and polymerase domains
MKKYDQDLPFVKETARWVGRVAGRRGYIRSLSGRRHRYDQWEPSDWYLARLLFPPSDDRKVKEDEVARMIAVIQTRGAEFAFQDVKLTYPLPPNYRPRFGTKLAYTWRALNRLLQGGAADILKKAMVDFWEAGLDRELPMLLTIHDEFGHSQPPGKRGREAVRELTALAEAAYPLKVPLTITTKAGKSWGDCADVK